MAGKTTLSTLKQDDVTREYFSDPTGSTYVYFNSIPSEFLGAPKDTISGTVRPLGMGPRVPMLVVSPWSRGGWVNSEVFDHTSVAQFIEQRTNESVPTSGTKGRFIPRLRVGAQSKNSNSYHRSLSAYANDTGECPVIRCKKASAYSDAAD
jgi:hypothetical protein